MVEAEQLRKAQLKMLEILTAIDDICVRHDIKYWLAYGTLLGAVRHQGFIPWDDDCDICMMREDYERFVEIAKEELPENLLLQSHDTDPNYWKTMTKIRMKGTKLVEKDESENEEYHQGIFVDIFIMDYYSEFYKNVLEKLSVVQGWKYKRKEYPKGSWKRMAIQIGVALPYLFYSTSIKLLRCLHISSRKNSRLPYIAQEIKGCDVVFVKKEAFFPTQRSEEFEGLRLCVPNDSDKCLSLKYGEYMVIPPEEKRHWHARKIEC